MSDKLIMRIWMISLAINFTIAGLIFVIGGHIMSNSIGRIALMAVFAVNTIVFIVSSVLVAKINKK